MKTIKKRFTSAALSLLLAAAAIPHPAAANAATSNWKFDFGGSGTASGYTGVSASTGYSASQGYGFAQTKNVSNVTAGGKNAGADAVAFNSDDGGNTFNVDLPKGLYQVTVTTGNAKRCSIKMEGMLQIMNMTGTNAVETIEIPVTDGQLSIQAVTGIANGQRSISAVEIKQLNTTGVMDPHIWICGDSTVANYYNVPDTQQHGWGQFLGNYLKDTPANGYVVRNMATSGQYAKGFYDSGQFAPIEAYGKSGDYYLIAIGINDQGGKSTAEEYSQVVTTMVQKAKAKGMQVVLIKQQGRRADLNRSSKLSGRWFGGVMDTIAQSESIPALDLFNAWQDFGLSLGYDAMAEYYAVSYTGSNDDLHQSKKGSVKLAELVSALLFAPAQEAGTLLEGAPDYFLLRNGSSGQYLTLTDAPADGVNVVQTDASSINERYSLWKAVSDGNGYYNLISMADETKRLDVADGAKSNGTNIGIWSDTGSDAQCFKFMKQENGSYILATKASSGNSAVEVKNASDVSGENVQEWERNGHAYQTWFLDVVHTADMEVLQGDLNDDGVIDVFDLALMKREALQEAHTHTARRLADLNGDSAVNAEDIRHMTDYLHCNGELSGTRQVHYAMDQNYSRGYYEQTNAGFVSEAYVNLANEVGSFIEFCVTAPTEGSYLCSLNVANGSAVNRQMKIQVNNAAEYWIQDFLTTESWTNWMERTIVLPLKAGRNSIRLTSATSDGGPNIDYLRIERTDEPPAAIYTEPEPEPEVHKTTIYIAGDSTVQSYNASARRTTGGPIQGWGYFLGSYLTDNVVVSNKAIAGRSSKSYYDQGRLQSILDVIQDDDYLFVQFAINDSAASIAERYAPVCGNVNTPTSGSYEWYMTQFIQGAQKKGATPVLVTTTLGAKNYTNGKFTSSYTAYCDACKNLAKKI